MTNYPLLKLLLAANIFAAAPVFAAQYIVTDLGTIGTDDTSYGLGLNNLGQVVGYSFNSTGGVGGQVHGYMYDGTMRDVGSLGGNDTRLYGINNLGQFVGESKISTGVKLGAAGSVGSALSALPPLIPSGTSVGMGISDSGQTIGYASVEGNLIHPFIIANGVLTDIAPVAPGQTAPEAANGIAYGINNHSQVVGSWNSNPFLYNATTGIFTTFGAGEMTGGQAIAINDSGLIVGDGYFGGVRHAFSFDGTIHDLGSLGTDSMASDVNNAGQIVGQYLSATGYRSFIYDTAHGMLDLGSTLDPALGLTLWGGGEINDAGQILTNGFNLAFQSHALILTPASSVPEPESYALLLAGIGVIAATRRNPKLQRLATK